MPATLTKVYPAEVNKLPAIRQFVYDRASSLNADQELLSDVILAVTEIVTNVIIHGYDCQAGEIQLEVRLEQDSLIVQISDDAPCFDPTLLEPPDISLPLGARPIGKMGVFLAKQLVDEIIYESLSKTGNRMTLIKHHVIPSDI
jgi:serine/threonine-protein kinase RsbW